MKPKSRSESQIWNDLTELCQQPGYVHAVAALCFRDNVILYAELMEESDLQKMSDPARLIRTEFNTLLGLMAKAEIDWTLPSPDQTQAYADASERLMLELHDCLTGNPFEGLTKEALDRGEFVDPFSRGESFREPMFYAAESAYVFQYLDFAGDRYAADAAYLEAKVGFNIAQAAAVVKAIEVTQSGSLNDARDRLRLQHPDEWTMTAFFTFSAEDVAKRTGMPRDLVDRILSTFTLEPNERNEGFQTLHDFNVIAATPLLRAPDGQYLSLQLSALAETLYESPFYWMVKDRAYGPTLDRNRGAFTERFAANCLRRVFGNAAVFSDVEIVVSKGETATDIDVMVVWANRVILVQAKSKRLTLPARKGNDEILRDDFTKAVQAAYDQGAVSARLLTDGTCRLSEKSGRPVPLPPAIGEIYLLTVVSDHYPALSFQTRKFLKTRDVDRLQAPMVLDIFALDVMSEMLKSPLRFLSYMNRRANYADRILASNEMTVLGYHLKKNLWVEANVSMMHLEDSLSAPVDLAMLVRRAGAQGLATPDGVLTRFVHTTIGHIVAEIEARPEQGTVDLGFLLLAMSEEATVDMSRVIDRLAEKSRADRRVHDATFAFGEDGITFHITGEPLSAAAPRLDAYCRSRKYKERAAKWFGLCLSPDGIEVRLGVSLTYPWVQDDEMDVNTREMLSPMPTAHVVQRAMARRRETRKVGRNERCPCGSGLKYKMCCLA